MSARAASEGRGAEAWPSAPSTLRDLIDARREAGRRITLESAVSLLVPVCLELGDRHARGEKLWVYASCIAFDGEGGGRVTVTSAEPPVDMRDRSAIAPELIKTGTAGDARASVFAIGATLYEALTGCPVAPGMPRPRDLDPALPEALEGLLAKALIADPSWRPENLGALAAALHSLAPRVNVRTDVDERALDEVDGHAVDVRLSLLPPPAIRASLPPPSVRLPREQSRRPIPLVATDATEQLTALKARLESDLRARYVVNRDRMDHGPFSAVELLQQIASNHFRSEDILRDDVTGTVQAIGAWSEFAPFAQHARILRELAQETADVAKAERAEKKAGAAKFLVSSAVVLALVGGGTAIALRSVADRRSAAESSDDPSAMDLSGGGTLRGGAKKPTPTRGGRVLASATGEGSSGASYDEALNQGSDVSFDTARTPDLTDVQLKAPLASTSFLGSCGVPGSMKVTIKTAVRQGRAVGVSVATAPANGAVAACIDHHIRALSWPSSAHLDSFTTTF